MDKRIMKTKKALKESLFLLLQKKNFDSIKITEICENALVSRNTFYNYYADKYALLEDCFADYEENFLKEFDERQKKNNAGHDVEKSFLNLIDTFFDNEHITESVSILSSFDLAAMYYRSVMKILEKYEDRYSKFMNPDYDLRQLNSFLVLGFWGFIHMKPNSNKKETREKTRKLMKDLLKSPIFRLQNGKSCTD